MFSGIDKKQEGDGPDAKMRKAVAQALKRGEVVVRPPKDDDEEEEKVPQKKGRQVKTYAGLNHSMPQVGGFPPLLLGIAGSLLSSLAVSGVEKLIDHFTGDKKQKGKGGRELSKQEKIDFLLKNVHPQKIINAVESIQ